MRLEAGSIETIKGYSVKLTWKSSSMDKVVNPKGPLRVASCRFLEKFSEGFSKVSRRFLEDLSRVS